MKVISSQEEYQREVSEFLSVLHDFVLSNVDFSPRTVSYLLRHIEELGLGMNDFLVGHPIFYILAKCKVVTPEIVGDLLRLSQGEARVVKALAHNEALTEDFRTMLVLGK